MTDGLEREIDRRILELAARYRLSDPATPRLWCLLRSLLSDPLAPTSLRDPVRAVDDHLADSLVALELEEVRTAGRVADLGTGAGLPGLPLAIAMSEADFALIESSARKCGFLSSVVSSCEVPNVEVIRSRAESWEAGFGRFDLATARALAALPVVLEYAAPLLVLGGRVVVWRGRHEPAEEDAAADAGRELGLRLDAVLNVQPYRQAQNRHLHVWSKVRETPPRFPRRPGIAVKRPLGAQQQRSPSSDRGRR